MNYRDYITIEPNKRGGKPCVRGLRITVYEVLEYLASEMTEAEILDDFPDLTREDLKACIAYANVAVVNAVTPPTAPPITVSFNVAVTASCAEISPRTTRSP